ncbi:MULTISPECIES: pilus assembly PilX family protein [unclassified Nocardioides]|uniref:pilus assembly PilX family protein n=1 Tax=unclassified Nocardioides TaxID=2615069 RepID=UPI00361801E0
MRWTRSAGARRDDRGSAMVITLMVMSLVLVLSTTVAVLTIDNLRGSLRAQQAGSAVNAADAGVAQAIGYLRSNGVRALNQCSPDCGSALPWGDDSAPMSVDVANDGGAGETYRVWIEKVRAYPDHDPGRYVVHSTGTAGGEARRTVSVQVDVTATTYPRGIFARSVSGGGNASVTHQSVFSTGCVARRDQIKMIPTEIDLAYEIPVGVHTSDYITEQNVNSTHCTPSEKKLIHDDGPCNTAYPNDQDRLGASLASTGCASVQTSYPQYYNVPALGVVGSRIPDDAALMELFGFRDEPFTADQLDQLRAVARAQGNYTNTTTPPDWSPDEAHAVMFFDLTGASVGDTVTLNSIQGFTSATTCTKSLVVVIEGGNAKLNSNQDLAAALFLTSRAPNGEVVKANGTSDYLGTIYADKINLVGTTNLSLDDCFVNNPSPYLLDFEVGVYHEADRALN